MVLGFRNPLLDIVFSTLKHNMHHSNCSRTHHIILHFLQLLHEPVAPVHVKCSPEPGEVAASLQNSTCRGQILCLQVNPHLCHSHPLLQVPSVPQLQLQGRLKSVYLQSAVKAPHGALKL